MNDAIKTNRTAPKLTEAQRKLLAEIQNASDLGGWLRVVRRDKRITAALERRGLISSHFGWGITDAGRAALRGES